MAVLQVFMDRADEGAKQAVGSAAGKGGAKRTPAKKTAAKKTAAKKTGSGRKRQTG
ncbi:hypothetical protein [Streptomyces roseoverticillatus]|uniref:hypothetical protein n=1 Tax=Streptomyces roseoverticillatus TaxID=66429 RepID=UPI001F1A8927|nr:hypothetical protein [Streptomyces roseoverticillatus]